MSVKLVPVAVFVSIFPSVVRTTSYLLAAPPPFWLVGAVHVIVSFPTAPPVVTPLISGALLTSTAVAVTFLFTLSPTSLLATRKYVYDVPPVKFVSVYVSPGPL